jgi:hypothetical protein
MDEQSINRRKLKDERIERLEQLDLKNLRKSVSSTNIKFIEEKIIEEFTNFLTERVIKELFKKAFIDNDSKPIEIAFGSLSFDQDKKFGDEVIQRTYSNLSCLTSQRIDELMKKIKIIIQPYQATI